MFATIDYLKHGNERQQKAFHAITHLRVMKDLADYKPVLCGTIPIEIDVASSDLDIIFEVHNFTRFQEQVIALYGHMSDFKISQYQIRNKPIIKANFIYEGFEFELFGQAQPVNEQNAYRHMIIENYILNEHPHLRQPIITLKTQGYKTEPAFCMVLGLEGENPYSLLLKYGEERGII
ncbi:DUF4269 domain-containing protein [Alkalihalobacterium chitinilyticum]|uniref:DUF4269 domain-containing protein n=1 Tax=Alkalihalobacterium chitinilyticum TaxID=2980103 RepID=A0ABT5VE22_9BACI|nr:DUF4269 domain-containing protein [Alkalihalobacterium chitinilyticum]MDE5413711.1 DUF4269 domain-containing protein [Alkalihalobacterium chitinilyticum]